jgi:geranylgeranyl diphosphate synthase type II
LAGALLAGASERQQRDLYKFASHLGLAFQIRDDILDIEGSEDKIGKRVGSDVEKKKVTYPSLLTMEGAKEKLALHIAEAKRYLQKAGVKDDVLQYICDLVATRDH